MFTPADGTQALQQFIEQVIEKYAVPWYVEITSDSAFLDELRRHLRFLLATAYIKFRKLDVRRLVSRVLPALLRDHLRACWQAHRVLRQSRGQYALPDLEATAVALFEVRRTRWHPPPTLHRTKATMRRSRPRMRRVICAPPLTAFSRTCYPRSAAASHAL